uniref:Protein N-terminal glutamine amidohydrolase n=1 Tax=Opuntia streptacantha TaxID=393608 RepID=A0A7C9DGT6_OPUST
MDSSQLPQFDHSPNYCEENVYRLCKKLSLAGIADREASDLYVVFISNDKKQIKRDDKSPQVWDLDSTLAFPSPLASYIAETFHPSFQLFSEYQRFYRIVHAPIFLRRFASDRRHMKDSDGNWTAQPPSYDPIVAEGMKVA